MKTLVVINTLFNDERSHSPLIGSRSAFDLVCDFAEKIDGFDSALVVASSSGIVPGIPMARPFDPGLVSGRKGYLLDARDSWTPATLLAQAYSNAKARDCDTVVFLHGDTPFLSRTLGDEVMGLYSKYRVDYAYADGYPLGLSPEIVSSRALDLIAQLACKLPDAIERDLVFQAIAKDINTFDIETAISKVDLREFRIAFACSGKRGRATCEKALNAGILGSDAEKGLFDHIAVCDRVPSNLSLLRTVPAFYSIQIVGECPQECSYCPYPKLGSPRKGAAPMKVEDYARLMDEIVALSGDAVVDISLWGDPLLHPDFADIVRATLSRRDLSLIVETAGLNGKPGEIESLAAEFPSRLYWVVSLDAHGEAMYGAIRGSDGYRAAKAFADRLIALFPETAYVQAVRCIQNEEELDGFYRDWKAKTPNVIIQKYDHFCGRLEERKVVDLSPLARRPCWHLARDLCVLLDGSVPVCRDMSLGPDFLSVGNALVEGGLEAAWKSGEARFGEQAGGINGGPCGGCDEYYTYNF